jgi:hypothetical protein
MKIRYKNTLEDIVAFHRHLYSYNAVLIRQKRVATIFMPLVFFMMMIGLYLMTGNPHIFIWGSVFVVAYIFFIRQAYRSGLEKKIRQIYENSQDFLYERQLEISDDGVWGKTDINERRNTWPGIPMIASEGDYTFIYLGTTEAHVLSRKNVCEGDYDGFVATAKSLWQQKNGSSQTA